MKTLAVDKYQRVRLPGVKGGERFAFENKGNGVLVLTELKPVEVEEREVKLVKGKDGRWRWPEGAKVTSDELRAAIRADRDR